jgi:hypothetical protein
MRDANAPLLSTGALVDSALVDSALVDSALVDSALVDSALVDSAADMSAEERGRMNFERMWRAFFGSGERMTRAFCAQAG